MLADIFQPHASLLKCCEIDQAFFANHNLMFVIFLNVINNIAPPAPLTVDNPVLA
jgi:hypothetical protein